MKPNKRIAAIVVAVLAWADLVLASALDDRVPGLRQRMRRETHARVVEPFLGSREWHWLGLDGHLHNWNPWIHGHLLAAALFHGAVDEVHGQEEQGHDGRADDSGGNAVADVGDGPGIRAGLPVDGLATSRSRFAHAGNPPPLS